MCMIPDKLKPGDEVRIVAPARSASDIDEEVLRRAKGVLESLGLKITFSKMLFLGVNGIARQMTKKLKIYTKRLLTVT